MSKTVEPKNNTKKNGQPFFWGNGGGPKTIFGHVVRREIVSLPEEASIIFLVYLHEIPGLPPYFLLKNFVSFFSVEVAFPTSASVDPSKPIMKLILHPSSEGPPLLNPSCSWEPRAKNTPSR